MPSPSAQELGERLRALAQVTRQLPDLPEEEVRRHVDEVRQYVHDDVLSRAPAEDVALGAGLGQAGGPTRASALAAEDDTLRDALGSLDDLVDQPLDDEAVERLEGLLRGIEEVVTAHLSHGQDVPIEVVVADDVTFG